MDLFEHQAKELFAEYGVPVPQGRVAATPDEARAIAADFAAAGTPRVVVKAQVKTGGRGKAGGVKLADGPDEAAARATDILGMDIKGHTVHKVLVEEASQIAQELIDAIFRRDINAARGFVEEKDVAAARQPTCDHDFLLVPAA